MALRENVLNLVRRFPWIRDTYADMLTVETAAEIINEKSQFSTLIDVDIAFVKFLNFWNAVAAKKKGTPVSYFCCFTLCRYFAKPCLSAFLGFEKKTFLCFLL